MGTTGALIVAAGNGTRMRSIEKKQFLPLLDKPVLAWTVDVFEQMEDIQEIVIVVAAEDVARVKLIGETYHWRKVRHIVPGGSTRQDSVLQGLDSLSTDWALVHDGVRPLVKAEDVQICLAAAKKHGGALLGVPVKDTIKRVTTDGKVKDTPDRETLWAIHTPQIFQRSRLREGLQRAAKEGWRVTDDASIIERLGDPIIVIADSERNIKITTPEDLAIAEMWLRTLEGETK